MGINNKTSHKSILNASLCHHYLSRDILLAPCASRPPNPNQPKRKPSLSPLPPTSSEPTSSPPRRKPIMSIDIVSIEGNYRFNRRKPPLRPSSERMADVATLAARQVRIQLRRSLPIDAVRLWLCYGPRASSNGVAMLQLVVFCFTKQIEYIAFALLWCLDDRLYCSFFLNKRSLRAPRAIPGDRRKVRTLR